MIIFENSERVSRGSREGLEGLERESRGASKGARERVSIGIDGEGTREISLKLVRWSSFRNLRGYFELKTPHLWHT